RRRGLGRADRVGRRPRAGQSALRPCSRRARVDADARRAPCRTRCAAVARGARADTAAPAPRRTAGCRAPCDAARSRERPPATRSIARARTQGSPPRGSARPASCPLAVGDARARLCDRPLRRRCRADAGTGGVGRCRLDPGRGRDVRGGGRVTFEEAERELEQIVERLERGDAGVEELTKLWERGEELYRLCVEKLESVRGRIEELSRSG